MKKHMVEIPEGYSFRRRYILGQDPARSQALTRIGGWQGGGVGRFVHFALVVVVQTLFLGNGES